MILNSIFGNISTLGVSGSIRQASLDVSGFITNDDLTCLTKFTEEIKKGTDYNVAYTATMEDASLAARGMTANVTTAAEADRMLAQAQNTTRISTDASTTSIVAQTAAIKAWTIAKNVMKGLLISLAVYAVSKGIEYLTDKIYESTHAVEIAEDKIKDIREEIDEGNDKLADHKKLIDEVKDSYDGLAKGVNLKTNENISLSDEDYQKFIDMNNELAEAYPTLQTGTDNYGNAILQIGKNGETAAKGLQKLYDQEEDLNNFHIAQNFDEEISNVKTLIDDTNDKINEKQKEIDSAKKYRDESQALLDNGFKFDENDSFKFSMGFDDEYADQYIRAINSAVDKFAEKNNLNPYDLLSTNAKDDGTYEYLINATSLTEEQKEKLSQTIQDEANSLVNEFSEAYNTAAQEQSELKNSNELLWQETIGDYAKAVKSTKAYKGLDADMQVVADNLMSSLDSSMLDSIDAEDEDAWMKYFAEHITEPLSNMDYSMKVDLSDILNFDTESNLSPTELVNLIDKLEKQCKEKGIDLEIPVSIKEDADDLLQQYEDAIKAAKEKFNNKDKEQILADAQQNLQDEYDKITGANGQENFNLGEYADKIKNGTIQSVFGNVDMDKRTIIHWSDELKQTYADALKSWDYDPKVGSIDTVFGMSDRFGENLTDEGWEIAFTPILPDGTFLSKDTVYDYINSILEDAYEDDGKVTDDELREIDAQGRYIGDTFVQGIYAGVDDSLDYDDNGNWADVVGRLMHFSGKDGAVQLAKQAIQDAQQLEGNFDWESWFEKESINTTEEIKKIQQLIDTYNSGVEARNAFLNADDNNTKLSFTDTIAQVQDLSAGLDQLDKIYADIYDKEDFDWSSILNNADFTNTFQNCKETYDDFIKTISNSPSDLSACQSAFNNLVTEYINGTDVMKNLTEETKASTVTMLEQMGVENADQIVTAQLTAQKLSLKVGLDDLDKSSVNAINRTYEMISGLISEGDASGVAATALYELIAEQTIFSNQSLGTASKIQELGKLAVAFGITADSANDTKNAIRLANDASTRFSSTDGYNVSAKDAREASLNASLNKLSSSYEKKIQDKFGSISANFTGGATTKKAKDDAAKAAKSAKDASDSTKETAETLDWIEKKLKLASKATEKLGKSFDRAFGMNQARERYQAYVSQIESEIQDNTRAAQVYQEKLNQIGLAYEWIVKIQSGAFSIDSITDENLKTQITEYQTYSDKLNSCYETIESLEEKRLQASVDYAEKVIDSHEKEINSINKLIDRRKALVSLKETFGLSASKSDLKYQQDQYENEINALERQNKEIYDLMWTTTYGDEAWQKYNDQMIENTSSIQDLTQSLADLASEMANLPIDKYEKAMDKISGKNDLLEAKLSNATSDKTKSKILGSQLKLTRKKDNSAQSAANTTKSNLDQSVKDLKSAAKTDNNLPIYDVSEWGPSEKSRTAVNDYYKKVKAYTKTKKQIPASLISKISDDGYSTLAKSCSNYNAALVANDTAQATAALSRETIRQELADLAEQRASLAKTTADSKVEKYDSKDELYDAKLDNAVSVKSKNKIINNKISNINNRKNAYNNAVKTDNSNIKTSVKAINKIKSTKDNKKILASIKKAAKAGKKISQSLLDKAAKLNDAGKLYDACIQYNAYLDARESDKATADLYAETAKQDKATLAKEKFDNIVSNYDNKISSNEQKKTEVNNRISLAEEYGQQAKVSDYKSLISAENGEYQKLLKEHAELQRNLKESVADGSIKEGSDEWYDMVAKINDVTNAIDESIRSIKEYKNALRQLKWDTFDKSLETVGRITSENDYYLALMSNKDMTDKDTGNFTEYGTASIGLHKTNYDTYMAEAEAYQNEYNNLMRQIEKGEASLNDENVVQRLRDLQDAHRDARESAEDELKSIQDLVKQGYEAQTDALSKLIEKYKKLKDSELEAYKYQKEISEKTKTIASLQKQLTAYNGNDSEESRAQIQKLKVELQDAKDDLKDTQYEKFISDTEDMLDDLMNDYQEFIDEKLNDTNTILDDIKGYLSGDIIATLKSLDSNLTKETEDTISDSTTNGEDSGQGAKDYTNNTIQNDQNTINSEPKGGLIRPTAVVGLVTLDNSLESKKKNNQTIANNIKNESAKQKAQRASYQENVAELEKQLQQLYSEMESTKNSAKKNELNARIQDIRQNRDMYLQRIANLDKQLASFKGYATGSKRINESQLAWTQEDKREMIYRASDGAVLTKLNPGDKVFTNEMTENLWKMAQMNPALLYSGTNFAPKIPDIAKSTGTSTIVEVGDIVMNSVNDPETFGRQLREEICKNGKTTQCITEAISAKQFGKNRNSIGNARLYK